MQLLTFTLGGDDFGIPLENIELVEGRSNEIVELPVTSAFIKGIATIRGSIVPIYSLALRFGYNEENLRYFIIVNMEEMRLGIEVDVVNAIIDANEAEVLSVPTLFSGRNDYLRNIVVARQKRMIILIDVNSLLPHEEKAEIHQLIAEGE